MILMIIYVYTFLEVNIPVNMWIYIKCVMYICTLHTYTVTRGSSNNNLIWKSDPKICDYSR